MQAVRRRWQPLVLAALATVLVAGLVGAMSARGNGDDQEIRFPMVRSAAAANGGCLANASAKVKVENEGAVEEMTLKARGLPPDTNFDFFVIQVPNTPVRPLVVPGRLRDRPPRQGEQEYVGRFNIETFIVAPGTASAPMVHPADATHRTRRRRRSTRSTWACGSTRRDDAMKAGCPATVTPFNGDHTAGIQALSTRNFADDQGPLRQLMP